MVAINLVRFGSDWPTYPLSHYLVGFSIATAIHLVINYFVGLYEREPRLGSRPWLSRTLLATASASRVQALAFVVLDRYLMPRLNLVVFAVSAASCWPATAGSAAGSPCRRQGPPRVVLVGTTADAAMARRHLADSDRECRRRRSRRVAGRAAHRSIVERDATDVLLLDVDAFGVDLPRAALDAGDRAASGSCSGSRHARRCSACATSARSPACRSCACRCTPSRAPARVQAAVRPRHRDRPRSALAAGSSVLLSLYVIGARRAARCSTGSSAWVSDGRPFRVVKFRTMVPRRRDGGVPSWPRARRSAPRPRRCAGCARRAPTSSRSCSTCCAARCRSSAPGPSAPSWCSSIAARVPGYVRRHELPPGLTGLAQIHGRYATDAEYKLGYDLQYLVNWSPILDLQILVQTVWVVLSRRV